MLAVPTWLKYLLFQMPGWIVAAGVLGSLWHLEILPKWLAVVGFGGWIVKDLFLYPFVRTAYQPSSKTGSQALVGARGIAADDLAPEGFVRVRGELWRAIANPNDQMIHSGTEVQILAAEGMTLRVRALKSD
ncbi:MAG TPA: NfeD family protein [Candidatus Binatia bacterium]|nr:NfeD family protein [Candidatus Binatia bacterium]